MGIPKNIIQFQYTYGNEFVNAISNQNYVGNYYELAGKFYAGEEYNINSPLLLPKEDANKLFYTSDSLIFSLNSGITSQQLTTPELTNIPSNTAANATFYCKQINISPTSIKPIDQKTYESLQSNPFFKTSFVGTYRKLTQDQATADKQLEGGLIESYPDNENTIPDYSNEPRPPLPVYPLIFSCFVGDTLITLPNKEKIKIKDLTIGTELLTYNEITKTQGISNVVNIIPSEKNNIISLKLNNEVIIECTEEHPIWVVNKGWCSLNPESTKNIHGIEEVSLLSQNDMLLGENEELIQLTNISLSDIPQTVYNLIVDGDHTYYANGILVHNKTNNEDFQEKLWSSASGPKAIHPPAADKISDDDPRMDFIPVELYQNGSNPGYEKSKEELRTIVIRRYGEGGHGTGPAETVTLGYLPPNSCIAITSVVPDANGSYPTYPVQAKIAKPLICLFEAANRMGFNLGLKSGFRQPYHPVNVKSKYGKTVKAQSQDELYWLYNNRKFAKAAPPNTSNHGEGLATDTSIGGVEKNQPFHRDLMQWMCRYAWQFGFVRAVPTEEWHWEYRPGEYMFGRNSRSEPHWRKNLGIKLPGDKGIGPGGINNEFFPEYINDFSGGGTTTNKKTKTDEDRYRLAKQKISAYYNSRYPYFITSKPNVQYWYIENLTYSSVSPSVIQSTSFEKYSTDTISEPAGGTFLPPHQSFTNVFISEGEKIKKGYIFAVTNPGGVFALGGFKVYIIDPYDIEVGSQ